MYMTVNAQNVIFNHLLLKDNGSMESTDTVCHGLLLHLTYRTMRYKVLNTILQIRMVEI